MSVSSTSPATLFGGTWEQLKDRFLVGAGNSYSANSTGGNTTHLHTLSKSGYALIGNYSNTITFADGSNITPLVTDVAKKLGYTPYYWTHNTDTSTTSTQSRTVPLSGNTDSSNSLPPYLAVYMWRRTA